MEVTVALQHPVAAGGELVVPLETAGAVAGVDFTVALDTTKSDSGVTLLTSGSHSAQNPALRFGPAADSAVVDFTAVDNKDRSQPFVSVAFATGSRAPDREVRQLPGDAGFVIADDETGDLVVPADWPLLPHDAGPGDRFRLLFVTSDTRNAQSAGIDAYDDFVRSVVAHGGHEALKPYGGLVSVVGSTASADARAHTAMRTGSAWADAGDAVPIVWLAEDPDADLTAAGSYSAFYSTTAEWALQDRPRNEAGGLVAPDSAGYFTGTARDGTKRAGFELGKTRAGIGVLNSAAAGRTPLFDSTSAGTVLAYEERSFYALSPVFAVAAGVSGPADAVFAAVPSDLALAENANGSTTAIAVGSPVVASDANGDKITYGLEGVRPAGWPGGLAAPKPPAGFEIDAGSGQISYTGTGVDREALPGGLVAMVVTATSVGASGTAATVRQPVSVTVTDVDEGDAAVVLAGVAVAGRSTLELDGVSGDPDGDPASAGLMLQWQASSAKSGPWAAATGAGHNTASYGVPAVDAGRWLRLRVSYTDGGGTAETVFSDPVEVGTLSLLSVLVEPTAVLGAGSKVTDKASLAVSLDGKVLAGETVSVPLVFAGGALGTDFTLALAGSPQGVTLTGATVKFTGPSAAAASATVELTATSAAALAKKITVKPGTVAATGGSLAGTRLAGSASRGGLLVSPDPVPAAVTVSLARADSGPIVEHVHAGTPAGDRDAELTVTLDRALTAGEQVQVPLVVSGTGVTAGEIAWALKAGDGVNAGVRLGGSALAPTVTFSAGARAASLLLAASDDFVDEDDETVTVALGDLAGGGLSTSVDDVSASDDGDPNTVDNTVAVVVTDNDTAGVVVAVVDGLTYVAENGGTDTYTVRLSSQPTHDVVVTVTSGDQTAARVHADSGSPAVSATLTFRPVDWHAAQTVTVTGVDDSTARPGTVRSVSVTHAAASDDDNYDGATGAPVAVRVGDASTAQVALTAPASVTEGRSVQVTATLTAALTAR